MIGLVVALPALLLAAGAGLARWPPRAVGRRAPWLVLAATGLALASAAGLLVYALQSPARSLRLALPGWSSSAVQVPLAMEVDALAAFCLLLVALVAFVASTRGLDGIVGVGSLAGPLGVAAAAALLVSASRVPLGLVLAWMALDLAVLVGAGGGRRGLLASQAGLVCLLMGLFALPPGAELAGLSLLPVADLGRLQSWLLLASVVRMGLFPVWWSVPRTDTRAPWRGAVVRLSNLAAGGYLFLRAMEGARPGEALDLAAMLPLALVLLACACLAWLARDPAEALDWRLAVQGALVLLAIRPGGPMYRTVGLVLLSNAVLAGLVLYLTADIARRRGVVVARRVADAALVGLPLTLGFQGRWPFYVALAAVVPFVLLTVVIGTTLAARPRTSVGMSFIPALGRHRAQEGLALLLAAAVVALGVWPWLMRSVLVSVTFTGPANALEGLASTLLDRLTAGQGLFLLALIVAPPLVGELLRRAPLPREPGRLARRQRLRRALSLTVLARGLADGVVRLGAVAQQASGMIEGRRSRAWTLLAVVVTGALMLAPPTSEAAHGLGRDPASAVVLFAAWVAGAAVVLSGRPATTLAAVAAGYILVGAILVAESDLWAGAAMVLVTGALAVAILALAEIQAPNVPSVGVAAQRLLAATEDFHDPGRVVLALALAAGLVAAYGIHSVSMPQKLPDAVLHPALALAIAGVLTAATARAPLRLAGGVLLALAAFQLAYAQLDPGVTMAAGLTVFQLLFAVIISYFVGLSAAAENPP